MRILIVGGSYPREDMATARMLAHVLSLEAQVLLTEGNPPPAPGIETLDPYFSGLPVLELKRYAFDGEVAAQPHVLAAGGRPNYSELRAQSRYDMSRKQQSLQSKARKR